MAEWLPAVEVEFMEMTLDTVVKCLNLGGEIHKLDGGFKYLLFSPLFGEDSHFD